MAPKKTTKSTEKSTTTSVKKTPIKPAIKKTIATVKAPLKKVTPEVKVAEKTAPKVKAATKTVNIPNLLTMIRIWAIPAIVFTFFIHTPFWAWMGVLLFVIAGITDYMDGYLARHLNQLSRFGRVLDPIADKLLVGAILLMLAYSERLGPLGIIPAVIIMCREILVSGLREFLAEIKVGCPVTRLAKWKTACQMTALPVLMVGDRAYSGDFWGPILSVIGMITLWGAAILTVMTGYDYWKSGRRHMDEE